jgi:hypothetical protein
MESSLTAPSDKNPEVKFKTSVSETPLSEEEANIALKNLTVSVPKFRQVERRYVDPPIHNQVYSLHSFIPSSGAVPDKDGIFGMIKIRGCFSTLEEADEKAELLIRNVDSYHKIFHGYVGKPMPICTTSDFSEESREIDLQKKTDKIMSDSVKSQRKDEQKVASEIKQREEELLADVAKDEIDPYDNYITLKNKKAQLSWTYLEHQKKMAEVKEVIIKSRAQLEELDKEFPDFQNTYYDKYMNARKESGLSTDDESYLRFLVEDADLGF